MIEIIAFVLFVVCIDIVLIEHRLRKVENQGNTRQSNDS